MTWTLDNAEERNRRVHTFRIPSQEERTALRVNDYAKLLFIFSQRKNGLVGERMWVKVVERNGDNYRGELANKPTQIKSLKMGDDIMFLPMHIIDVRMAN